MKDKILIFSLLLFIFLTYFGIAESVLDLVFLPGVTEFTMGAISGMFLGILIGSDRCFKKE